MFEVREIMVSVSSLERGLRGVLELVIWLGYDTPPAPSREGKSYSQLLIDREFSGCCTIPPAFYCYAG